MSAHESRLGGLVKSIGPGILFAGAAIGGSHLVQSTRAGADYGFTLIWIVILINLFKYPFFEFAHRYTAATGESLLQGYRRIGPWALNLFFFLAILAAVMNAAGVTLITAGLAGLLFGIDLSPAALSALLIATVALLLLWGRYPLLDRAVKLMICVLALATVATVVAAAHHGSNALPSFEKPAVWTLGGLSFLLALMGWMPAPIDVSVWPSLWVLEREKQTGHRATVSEARVDFHLGYFVTVFLALAFVSLGALVMYGTGEEFSASGVTFSGQLVSLYTQTLGGWSWLLIAPVAFITMFSTMLTVYDGYTRTLRGSMELIWPRLKTRPGLLYWLLFGVLAAFALAVIGLFIHSMKALVDLVTILAFLTAAPFAYLNYRTVRLPHVAEVDRPGTGLVVLAWLGMGFLILFSLLYIGWRLWG